MKIQTTCRLNRSKARGVSLAGCAIAALLIAGNAHAQWKVIDNRLVSESNRKWDRDKELQNAQKTKLEEMYEQQKFPKYTSKEKIAEEPEEKLDRERPSAAIDMGLAQRCPPSPPKAPPIAQQQQKLCEELVKTELAQYKYSLKMYDQTIERHKRLQRIEQERAALEPRDQGKLQDNSNKLLALLSLMEIDRQQQKTYMDAYEVRLRYLKAARDTLTQQALGGKSGANPVAAMIGAGVMRAALQAAQTERRYNSR